jgi:hypothetical protein
VFPKWKQFAGKKMTMEWKKQFRIRNLGFRDTCVVLLVVAVNLLVLSFFFIQFSFWRDNPEARSTASLAQCASQQRVIYRIIREVPTGEEFELPPEWTVADLIREAVGKERLASSPIPEKNYFCRDVRRGGREDVLQPYLVFPAPASVVFDDSLQPPVPILMCPPGAHGKLGSSILYSDGSVRRLSAENAEKLVAEKSPVPLKIDFESKPEESGKPQ